MASITRRRQLKFAMRLLGSKKLSILSKKIESRVLSNANDSMQNIHSQAVTDIEYFSET